MRTMKKLALAGLAALLCAVAAPRKAAAATGMLRSTATTLGVTPVDNTSGDIILKWCSFDNNSLNTPVTFKLIDGALSSSATFYDVTLSSMTSMYELVDFGSLVAGPAAPRGGGDAGLHLTRSHLSIMADQTSASAVANCQYALPPSP